VLDALSRDMGVELGCQDVVAIRRELATLPATTAIRPAAPTWSAQPAIAPGSNQAVLASWHQLIDLGSLTDGDKYLAGTARPATVRLSPSMARTLSVTDGVTVVVATERGRITLPAQVSEMPDGVVWVPTNSPGSTLLRTLGVTSGAVVTVSVEAAASNGGAQ
jgi:NADH-quinone oxidoreductase subunit G